MTDAHCHVAAGADRYFICAPSPLSPPSPTPHSSFSILHSSFFHGTHPWDAAAFEADALRRRLEADPSAGVGEIGLDRLKSRTLDATGRAAFAAQLEIAADYARPVALHGAKCWGEVVKACQLFAGRIPAFLFHGFSRSEGLVPAIAALNGFISIGPALLNDHAVNYRRMAAALPANLLLVESDRTEENAATVPSVRDIAAKLADLRGTPLDALAAQLEANADRFIAPLAHPRHR